MTGLRIETALYALFLSAGSKLSTPGGPGTPINVSPKVKEFRAGHVCLGALNGRHWRRRHDRPRHCRSVRRPGSLRSGGPCDPPELRAGALDPAPAETPRASCPRSDRGRVSRLCRDHGTRHRDGDTGHPTCRRLAALSAHDAREGAVLARVRRGQQRVGARRGRLAGSRQGTRQAAD
jgi:hypothetical protein